MADKSLASLNWLLRLKAIYDSLKTTEKRAADYIIRNSRDVCSMTISQAARDIDCSEATLFRLSKKVGFSGYPQLREACRSIKTESDTNLYLDIDPADSSEQVLSKVFSTTVLTLQNTQKMINLRDFETAVKHIRNSVCLSFYAIGGASSVATIGFYKFNRIGWRCTFYGDPDLSLISASQLKEGDAAVAISHSGRSKPVIDSVKLAKRSGAAVITITNFPLSPLAKTSDVVLLTSAFAEYSSGDVFANRVAQLCILESLYAGVVTSLQRNDPARLSGIPDVNRTININKL